MSAQAITGSGVANVSPQSLGVSPGYVPRTAAASGLWDRIIRLMTQMMVGLPPSTWLLLDVTILSFWLLLAYAVFPPPVHSPIPHVLFWQAAAVFAFAIMISSLIFGLYERETVYSRSRLLTRLALTTTAAAVVAYAVIYVVMYQTVSRRVSGMTMGLFLLTAVSTRMCAWWAVRSVHRGLLVVGPRALYDSFRQAQKNGFLSEYRLLGHVHTGPGDKPSTGPKDLGPVCDFVTRLADAQVTDVVVSAQAAADPKVMDWVVPCLQRGCRVTNEAIFYEKATGQILVDEITPYWFLFADLKVHCDQRATLKRLTDLLAAIAGLCLTAPLWPLIALGIKLNDGGAVFYSQNRVGQNGRIFKLYKFRTMRPDAENGKSVWASPDDPRVTRVGRILRKTRFDELPQLYNILMGQMSIVGPRPERPDIVEDLSKVLPYYAERHLLKPGLTGWAQISFRYGASVADAKRKLQFDLYYLKHMAFELDAMIILRTIGTFLRGAC